MGAEANGFFKRNRSVFKLGLVALLISATACTAAGLFLRTMEEFLLVIPGMMILIYSSIGMRGNIFGAMGSRIGTSMHMGTFGFSFGKGGVLRANIETSLGLTFFISLAMGVIGWIVVRVFNFDSNPDVTISGVDFIFISMFGGLLAGLILLVYNITIAKIGFKRGWDIDNVTCPLITAAGDIITIPMLAVSAWMVLNSSDTLLIEVLTAALIAFTVAALGVILIRKAVNGRRDEAKRIIMQSAPVLLMCLLLNIVAGTIIQGETEMLIAIPVLLILMPAFLNEGNALSGMLTSRLSSMLHLGTLNANKLPGREAAENFKIIYSLALVTYTYIATIGFVVAALTGGVGDIGFLKVYAIVMIAGMIATTILNFLSYYVAIAAVRFDLDPDDHSIPITSSSMDLIGAFVLVSVILLFVTV